jgi:hypothetical protein
MCKKKAAFSDGLKSREETPKKAYAVSLPHCNKCSEGRLVQKKRAEIELRA